MDDPNDMKIVLLGKTGSGKSSGANSILQGKHFDTSCQAKSQTQDCKRMEATVNGQNVIVIDTPGILDPDRKEDDLKYEIISCLTECAPGPHVFVFVVKVARYTQEEREAFKKLLGWFSQDALKHMVVLFTHGEDLEKDMTIKDFVDTANEALKDLVEKCENRYHVIDNKHWDRTSPSTVVQDLMRKMETIFAMPDRFTDQERQELLELRSKISEEPPATKEIRCNKHQIGKLMITINEIKAANSGECYTNEYLRVIGDAIETEVKIIQEANSDESNISETRKEARKRVKSNMLKQAARGVTVGTLMGALLGVVVGPVLPLVLIAGVSTAAYKRCTQRGGVTPRAEPTTQKGKMSAGAGAAGGVAAGLAVGLVGAEVGLGAAAATGIGLAAAGAVLAVGGMVGGGLTGAEAAQQTYDPKEAGKKAAVATAKEAGGLIESTWNLTQRLAQSSSSASDKKPIVETHPVGVDGDDDDNDDTHREIWG